MSSPPKNPSKRKTSAVLEQLHTERATEVQVVSMHPICEFQHTMETLEHIKKQRENAFGQELQTLLQDQMYCYAYKSESLNIQTLPTLSQVRQKAEVSLCTASLIE